ncbi:sulfate/molybdate ABC transporter ATP-binding protein [Nocardia sp. NPDC020380]|uniref:sulfate/molybdate ABC transporter ATP-binding protein n=1 Tax=Nocardia sp. NPDC020380 TaxID=3364309 RepID=UPI0037ACC06D
MADPESPVAVADSGLVLSATLAQRDFQVELQVPPGEVLAILGPNGAGKSTLLDMVAGLLVPDSGRLTLNGEVLTDIAKGIAVPPHKRSVSMLAQDALLFPHLSVRANVAFGPRSRGVRGHAAGAVAREWLEAVDMWDFARRAPGSLSGGQAQRVALARALAVRPEVLLLDEPMAALDVTAAPAMRTLLRRVLRPNPLSEPALTITDDAPSTPAGAAAAGKVTRAPGAAGNAGAAAAIGQGALGGAASPRLVRAVGGAGVAATAGRAGRIAGVRESWRPVATILVTHDIIDAVTLADRVAVIESGRVVESGPVATVLARPRSRFAARIAGVNLIVGTGADGETAGLVTVIDGDMTVTGRSAENVVPDSRAAAVFSPAAVAVHREHPEGSPRNVFRVRIAELEDRGGIVRVRAEDGPGATAGLAADLTPAAAAQLDLAPGMDVFFAVKATEVEVYSY